MRYPVHPAFLAAAAQYGMPMGAPAYPPAMLSQFHFPTRAVAGADIIAGAADVDPDAMALLSGFDVSNVAGAEIVSGGTFDIIAGSDYDVVAGDDGDYDIVAGAVVPRRRRPIRLPAARPAVNLSDLAAQVRKAKALTAQPAIIEKPYTRSRNLPLGLDSGAEINAGSSQTLTVFTNGPYKPQLLIIPDDVGPDFVITAIQFGRVNGLASANELPASTYSALCAKENAFDVDAVAPGNPIQVGVRNVSGANRRFRARFQGLMLES